MIFGIVLLLILSCLPYPIWNYWGNFSFHFVSLGLLFLWLIFSYSKNKSNLSFCFQHSPLDLPIILLSLIFCISFKKSLVPEVSLDALLIWLNYFFVYFFTVNFLKQKYSSIIFIIIILGTLLAGFGIYQRIFLKMHFVEGTFVNPNVFAGFLILLIPIIFQEWKNPGLKFSLGIIFFAGLFFTGSIGALISLCLAYFIFSWSKLNSKIKNISVLLVGTGLIFLLWNKFQEPDVYNRFLWWQGAVRMIWDHPFFGVGIGGFGKLYLKYRVAGLNSTFAHNFFLQIAGETGIIGLLIFIWLLLRFFRYSSSPGIKIGVAAVLIHNLVDYHFFLPSNATLFWVLLGLGISQGKEKKIGFSFSPINFLVLSGTIFLAGQTSLLQLFWAKQNLDWGEKALSLKKISLAEEKLGLATQLNPFSASAHYLLSLMYREKYNREKLVSYLDEAILELKEALNLEPENSYYWNELAKLYLFFGEKTAALKAMTQAVHNNFYHPRYHRELANIYIRLNQTQLAQKELNLAKGLQTDLSAKNDDLQRQ